MHIFVTGATGFVGSAVVCELLDAGHRVTGLARSEAGAEALAREGAAVHRGDVNDLPGLRVAAARADGVIHTAFNHDFSTFRANCEADRQVIEALGEALAGWGRPLVVTSGIGVLSQGGVATEETRAASGPAAHPRAASEQAAERIAARGGHASVVRLPPSVHGAGDHGFVPHLVRLARASGVSAHIGEGLNRWPAVHRLDAARLYRRAVESGEAGARYHAVAEEGIAFRDIAQVIGRRLGVPVRGLGPQEAEAHFGWFAPFAAMDVPSVSRWTQDALGWRPTGPGLLADLDGPAYFEG
ncbi:SDR family oxidoreductase [Ancylobacter moscoviensis]